MSLFTDRLIGFKAFLPAWWPVGRLDHMHEVRVEACRCRPSAEEAVCHGRWLLFLEGCIVVRGQESKLLIRRDNFWKLAHSKQISTLLCQWGKHY